MAPAWGGLGYAALTDAVTAGLEVLINAQRHLYELSGNALDVERVVADGVLGLTRAGFTLVNGGLDLFTWGFYQVGSDLNSFAGLVTTFLGTTVTDLINTVADLGIIGGRLVANTLDHNNDLVGTLSSLLVAQANHLAASDSIISRILADAIDHSLDALNGFNVVSTGALDLANDVLQNTTRGLIDVITAAGNNVALLNDWLVDGGNFIGNHLIGAVKDGLIVGGLVSGAIKDVVIAGNLVGINALLGVNALLAASNALGFGENVLKDALLAGNLAVINGLAGANALLTASNALGLGENLAKDALLAGNLAVINGLTGANALLTATNAVGIGGNLLKDALLAGNLAVINGLAGANALLTASNALGLGENLAKDALLAGNLAVINGLVGANAALIAANVASTGEHLVKDAVIAGNLAAINALLGANALLKAGNFVGNAVGGAAGVVKELAKDGLLTGNPFKDGLITGNPIADAETAISLLHRGIFENVTDGTPLRNLPNEVLPDHPNVTGRPIHDAINHGSWVARMVNDYLHTGSVKPNEQSYAALTGDPLKDLANFNDRLLQALNNRFNGPATQGLPGSDSHDDAGNSDGTDTGTGNGADNGTGTGAGSSTGTVPLLAYEGIGKVYSDINQATLNTNKYVARTLSSTLHAINESGQDGLWIQLLGDRLKGDDDGQVKGYDNSNQGVQVGFSHLNDGGLRLGGAFTYLDGDLTSHGNVERGEADSDNYYLTAFAEQNWAPFSLLGTLTYGWHDIDTKRESALDNFARHEQHIKAQSWQTSVEGRYRLDTQIVRLEPYANLTYSYLDADGFTEKSGPQRLSGKSETLNDLTSTLGVRASKALTLKNVPLSFYGDLGWAHQINSPDQNRQINLAQGPQQASLDVRSVGQFKDAAVVNLGVETGNPQKVSFSVNYNGLIGSGFKDHGFNAQVKIPF